MSFYQPAAHLQQTLSFIRHVNNVTKVPFFFILKNFACLRPHVRSQLLKCSSMTSSPHNSTTTTAFCMAHQPRFSTKYNIFKTQLPPSTVWDHITPVLQNTDWLAAQFKILLIAYKAFHKRAPSADINLLTPLTQSKHWTWGTGPWWWG